MSIITKFPLRFWLIVLFAAISSFTFGCINSLLFLYLHKYFYLTLQTAYQQFAVFSSLLFILPLIGGYTANNFGYLRTILFGAIAMGIAQALLYAGNLTLAHIGMAAYAAGFACFFPSYLALMGRSLQDRKPTIQQAFTVAYVIVNAFILIGIIISGWLAKQFSYHSAFFYSAVIQFVSLLLIISIQRALKNTLLNRDCLPSIKRMKNNITVICIIVLLAFISLLLITHPSIHLIATFLLIIASLVVAVRIYKKCQQGQERNNIISFLILTIMANFFWIFFSLLPSVLTNFIQNHVEKTFFGLQIPASDFIGFSPLFVIVLGALLMWIWKSLTEKGYRISFFYKFTIAYLSLAIALFIISLSIYVSSNSAPIHMTWIIVFYAFVTVAELCIAPTGQAMSIQLAPKNHEGIMMGFWETYVGFAGTFSGYAALIFARKKLAGIHNSLAIHGRIFFSTAVIMFLIAIICGILHKYRSYNKAG